MHRLRNALVAVAVAAATLGTAVPQAAATASRHYTLEYEKDFYYNCPNGGPTCGVYHVVRWNPCVRISYRINPGTSNTSLAAYRVWLVKQALARVNAATRNSAGRGIEFSYAGRTSYIPHMAVLHYPNGRNVPVYNAGQQYNVTHVHLVVAWASRRASNLFFGTWEAGIGVITYESAPRYDNGGSQLRILEGAALLVNGAGLPRGFVRGGSDGTLLLHELGHAMGLQHYNDLRQVMNPTLQSLTPAGYGTGDLAGMHRIGRAAGCMSTPALPVPSMSVYGVPYTP